MENIALTAEQVGILFAMIAVGAICRKLRIIEDGGAKSLVDLLAYIVSPCLVIESFSRPFDPGRMKSLALAFGVAIAVHFVTILAASAALRRKHDNTTLVLALALVFSNAGFMGIPMEQAIIGSDGVFFGMAYVSVFNLFFWTWGWSRLASSAQGGIGSKIRLAVLNPGTISLAIGIPLFLTSTTLPDIILAPVHHLANLNTPVAMLMIGYVLVGANLRRVATSPAAYAAAMFRLLACPILLVAAFFPFRHSLDKSMMLAMVIATAAPVAALVSIMSAKFGRDIDMAVGIVSGTTLLSIVTMPLVVALAMTIL